MLSLTWQKCQTSVWCMLNTVNLSHSHFNQLDGVYVIWHGGPNASTVYVGQGNIRERLQAHRNEYFIQKHASKGTLYVTWAEVAHNVLDSVERYLCDTLNPLEGDRTPNANPIQVNKPW